MMPTSYHYRQCERERRWNQSQTTEKTARLQHIRNLCILYFEGHINLTLRKTGNIICGIRLMTFPLINGPFSYFPALLTPPPPEVINRYQGCNCWFANFNQLINSSSNTGTALLKRLAHPLLFHVFQLTVAEKTRCVVIGTYQPRQARWKTQICHIRTLYINS